MRRIDRGSVVLRSRTGHVFEIFGRISKKYPSGDVDWMMRCSAPDGRAWIEQGREFRLWIFVVIDTWRDGSDFRHSAGFTFLQVNSAFSRLTGLFRERLGGRASRAASRRAQGT
jgi:hypothetical protein